MKKGKGRRRLETLIRFMEKLPRSANKHFDMGHFFNHYGDHTHRDDGGTLTAKGLFDCGTSACALGWAATCPALRKAGLSLKIGGMHNARFHYGRGSSDPFEVASRFFGISGSDAVDLFGSDYGLHTPKQWARFARKYVKAMTGN